MNHERIRKISARLAASLPSPTGIRRGSLLHRTIRHSSGCSVCARGKGHRVRVLTISYPGGRTKQISLVTRTSPWPGRPGDSLTLRSNAVAFRITD